MKLIHQNPFRILGLPVTATTREITKRISDLEMHLEIGKPVVYDTDFPFLSPVERSSEMVRHASNQIENDEDRFFNSLFWFWNANTTDELALDVLKEGNIEGAIRLLEKQANNGDNLNKLYSSAKNLSILYLALGSNGHSLDHEKFYTGLYWTGKTMSDDILKIFASYYSSNKFTYKRDRIENAFIDEVVRTVSPLMDVAGGISLSKFIPSFSTFPDETQRKVADRFVSRHFQTIEDAIALSEKEREANPKNANIAAGKLVKSTNKALSVILDALDDYRSQDISDKVSKELCNCSIAYLNHHNSNDTGTDPSDESLKIIKHAKKLATYSSTKKRIDDNLPIIESWVEGKQERERQKIIKPYIDNIFEIINDSLTPEDLELGEILKYSEHLISECKTDLLKIKSKIGEHDKLYVELSSFVINNVMDLCIFYANNTKKIANVVKFFNQISDFAMDSDTKERYERNKAIFIKNAELGIYLDPIIDALENAPRVDIKSLVLTESLIPAANRLIDSTKDHLDKLKLIDRKIYFDFSSAIAGRALSLCIEYANRTGTIIKPISLMRKIEMLEMEPSLKNSFLKNKEILKSNRNTKINNNIDRFCYIATMVYGHHDAPQVVALRKFRDNSLKRTATGRLFIKLYYKFSPSFVKHLGKYKVFHLSAKCILDRIVRRVS